MSELNEMLTDPIAGIELPEGAIVIEMIVLIQYIEPESSNSPNRTRLGYDSSTGMTAWESIGMLRFAEQLEYHAIGRADDD